MVNIQVFEEIMVGWKNLALRNNTVIEDDAKKRIAICVDCDKFRKNKTCALCGCYMPAKTRSPKSRCLKKLW